MSKIGEFEKTVIAEPLEEPFPQEKQPQKITEEPLKEPDTEPVEVSK